LALDESRPLPRLDCELRCERVDLALDREPVLLFERELLDLPPERPEDPELSRAIDFPVPDAFPAVGSLGPAIPPQ
jgi:hypothetical protein